MQAINKSIRNAKFSAERVPSLIMEAFSSYEVLGRSLVINPTPKRMYLSNSRSGASIAPFSSLIVVAQEIVPSMMAIVIDLPKDPRRVSFEFFEGWKAFGNGFYRSAQDALGMQPKISNFIITI